MWIVDLLKVNNTKFNDDYYHNILSAGYIPKLLSWLGD